MSELLRQSRRTGVSALVAPELDLLRVIADRALSRFTRKFHTDVTGERTHGLGRTAETRLRLCENEFRASLR